MQSAVVGFVAVLIPPSPPFVRGTVISDGMGGSSHADVEAVLLVAGAGAAAFVTVNLYSCVDVLGWFSCAGLHSP